MGDLKEQVYQQAASRGIALLRSDLQKKHIKKKDGRFQVKGITYDISDPIMDKGGVRFEISSKIPTEEFAPKSDVEKYYNQVFKLVSKEKKKPVASKMENILRNVGERELKERDYVKLIYMYSEQELVDPAEVKKMLGLIEKKKRPIPDFPGTATIGGKVVLELISESIHNAAKEHVQALISANEEIRAKFKK